MISITLHILYDSLSIEQNFRKFEMCKKYFCSSAMMASKKAEGLSAGLAADGDMDIGEAAEGAWGDDDLKLSGDEGDDDFADAKEAGSDEEGGWGVEDDLEIPEEMQATPVKGEDPAAGQVSCEWWRAGRDTEL